MKMKFRAHHLLQQFKVELQNLMIKKLRKKAMTTNRGKKRARRQEATMWVSRLQG
jgi:hypothetical protein